MQRVARRHFAFFDGAGKNGGQCFFENAGGAQVPISVVARVTEALNHRWRDNLGMSQKMRSRRAMLHILGFDEERFDVSYNLNSTSIFSDLACKMEGELGAGDEIVLSTSNHSANFDCWLEMAERVGCKVRMGHVAVLRRIMKDYLLLVK